MPIINVKVYEGRLNAETEPKLIAGMTQVLVDTFGEGMREHTTVILEEIKPSRWGVAGKSALRAQEGSAHMSVVEVNAPGLLDLVEADAELECIGSGFTFTEGPVWTNRDGGSLLFSDMPGDTRRRWSQAGGVEVVAHPSNKGNGLSWDLEGRLLICEHSTSSLIRVEPDGSRTVLASHWQGKELNSPNDVVVASDGSIVFTDPPYGRWPGFGVEREQELDFQGVYRVTPDGELQLLVDDFQKPNGLCFSPDEKTLWINDTDGGHVRRFSVSADGSLTGGEVIYQMEGSAWRPASPTARSSTRPATSGSRARAACT